VSGRVKLRLWRRLFRFLLRRPARTVPANAPPGYPDNAGHHYLDETTRALPTVNSAPLLTRGQRERAYRECPDLR
jgi:hypothetical protein